VHIGNAAVDIRSMPQEGGKPMACGWLTDRFGLCWQIVPRNIGELISHPKAIEAMMGMIKMDLPALEAAASEN
jgi:predicted 3-demethylubiquinone-9 3-methyltransferase (glyoxalase superfamily)